jgi:hypothetical protein
VTPNGSPASVSLTVITTKHSSLVPFPGIPRGGPLALGLWAVSFGLLGFLLWVRWRHRSDSSAGGRSLPLARRLTATGLALAVVLGSSGCRGVSSNVGTPTGNYTITIKGTLSSNTDVQRTVTFNLAVT